MKKFLSTIVLCIYCVMSPMMSKAVAANGTPAEFKIHECRIDGVDRKYKLYLPANLKPGSPLVFVLHGYTGNFNLEGIGFNEVADKYGVGICYPQGIKDSRGYTCWNVGYPFQEDMTVDDVSFICKLAELLQKEYKFSKRSTFCTGMSNGGEMCYLLAYCGQKTIKAVAPIAGLTLKWMPEKYPKARAIPLFELHGTEDRTSEWTGDPENKGGWGAYLAVPDAIDFWVKQNRCDEKEVRKMLPLKSPGSHKVVSHKYLGGKSGKNVWLYEIIGGGHSYGCDDLDVAEEIWKFFSQYVK